MTYDHLDQPVLAALIPELLLCGHLIDRSGMAHAIGAFGREGMGEIAIEEWMGASPVYTLRMRDALGITGHGVADMVKTLQHDVGAPPQFLDFRYTVTDENHGSFVLDYCGALMDVEPMGESYVHTMCHAIEDPTFDATAIATNPYARIRPVHRPPRVPTDRQPHCSWTITIDETRDPLPVPVEAREIGETEAARHVLVTDDAAGTDGWTAYDGPVVADVDWSGFSRSLLLRLADEICLQWHLLSLGFARAVRRRTDEAAADALVRKQLTGIAGLTSWRLRRHLGLPEGLDSVAAVLALHPVLNPAPYVGVRVDGDLVTFDRSSPGQRDAEWVRLLTTAPYEALDALVLGIGPTLGITVVADDEERLVVRFVDTGAPRPEPGEVAVTRFSKGADFAFADRSRMIPITPV